MIHTRKEIRLVGAKRGKGYRYRNPDENLRRTRARTFSRSLGDVLPTISRLFRCYTSLSRLLVYLLVFSPSLFRLCGYVRFRGKLHLNHDSLLINIADYSRGHVIERSFGSILR